MANLKVQPLRLSSMLAFHKTQDWLSLWEEFYLSIDASGRYRYRSVVQFANAKGVNAVQKEFLKFYLGPVPGDPELVKKYAFVSPMDWEHKRETRGWYTDENIKAGTKEVLSKMSALDALKEAGRSPLSFMHRIEKLAQKLDRTFLGGEFVQGKTEGENIARLEGYYRLLDKLLGMESQAFHLYVKSLGIDFSNLEGFATLVAATTQTQQQTSQAQSKFAEAMQEIVKMATLKAAKYGTKLPDDMERKMIEVASQPEPKKYKQ